MHYNACDCTEGEQTKSSTAEEAKKERRRAQEERGGERKETGWWLAKGEGKTVLYVLLQGSLLASVCS